MSSLIWLIFGLFIVCSAKKDTVFPDGLEVQYSVDSHVSSGTEDPASALSYFGIQAKLRIQGKKSTAIFQLEDVQYAAYNGAGTKHKVPSGEVKYVAISEEAASILKPFVVTFSEGQVAEVQLESSDVVWSKNFKRALVSQLQVNIEEITKNTTAPHVFTATEDGISGICKTHNLVTSNENMNKFKIRKFIEGSTCSKTFYQLDFYPEIYESKFKDSISSSTERKYSLLKSDENLMIDSITSRSGIAFQPFGKHGETQFHVTKQTLQHVSSGPVSQAIELSDPQATLLQFELPTEVIQGADFDLSFGAWGKSQQQLVDDITKTIYKLSAELDKDEEVKKPVRPELLITIKQMRYLGRDSILKIADTIMTGTSYAEETAQNIFLEMLHQVGTKASILTSIDLIMQTKIPNNEISSFVTSLPFYIRNVGPEILEDAKVLLTLGDIYAESTRRNGILAFATLLGNICKFKKCEPAVLDRHVRNFFSKLRESEEYGDQLLYLEALGNIEIGDVSEYLEPIIRGSLGYSHQLRFRAALLTADILKTQPQKVESIYWPILANRSESLELRCVAVTLLLTSQSSTQQFLNLLWFMTAEKNNYLYNFYYTTVKSLISNKQPEYMHLSPDAVNLAELIPEPQNEESFQGNVIFGYKEDKYGISSLLHFLMVGDEISGGPNVMSLNYVSKYVDTFYLDGTIFLRLEGVSHEIQKEEIINLGSDESTLHKLLKSLKVEERETKPMHIELIIRKQGHTIIALYLNETVAKSVGKVMATMFVPATSKDLHSNYQHADLSLMKEILQPSDLGFGVTIEQIAPYYFSGRTNFTHSEETSALAKKLSCDFRFSRQVSFNIRTANPLGGITQGVSRSTNMEVKLSMSLTASLDLAQKSIKLRWDWQPGKDIYISVQDSRTETFITGSKSKRVLELICPGCSQIFLATQGNNYRKNINVYKEKVIASEIDSYVNLVECEGENHAFQNKADLWNMVMKNGAEYQEYEDSVIMGMFATIDAVSQPVTRGTCGLKAAISSVGNASYVELAVKGEVKEPKWLLRGLLSVRDEDDKVLRTWDSNFIIERSEEKQDHLAVKARLTRQVPGEKPYAVCMKMENKYPERKSPWEILYHPDVIRETEHSLALEFGESEVNKCPSDLGTQIFVTGTSRTTRLDPQMWPLAQCEADRGNNKMYPASFACAETMKQRNQASNFTFKVRQNNVPAKLTSLMTHVTALHNLLGHDDVIEITKDFTVNIEQSQTRGVSINLANQEGNSVDLANSMLSHMSEDVVSLMSCLSQYPSLSAANMALDLAGLCAVAGTKLMTFDNATIDWPQNSKYKLLAADCSSDDKFGIFGSNPPGSESVDIRVYLLTELIEVKQGKSGDVPTIHVNGTLISDSSYSIDETEITRKGSSVTILQDDLELVIHISASSVAIVAPTSMQGETCGLCGDYNEDPEFPGAYPGPNGPISTQEEYITAYTLP